MTRKDLQRVYRLQKELEMWEEKERELICSMDSIGSPSNMEPTGVHSTRTSDRTGQNAVALSEISDMIMSMIVKLRIAQKEVVKFVTNIDDPLMREIIMYRCYDCLTWRDIAIKTGTSEDAARQMYSRFIKNM